MAQVKNPFEPKKSSMYQARLESTRAANPRNIGLFVKKLLDSLAKSLFLMGPEHRRIKPDNHWVESRRCVLGLNAAF
jgi:hypothetical protein